MEEKGRSFFDLSLSFYLWYKYLFRKTVYMKDIQSGIQSEFSPFDSGSGLDICFIGVSYDSVRVDNMRFILPACDVNKIPSR